MWAKFFWLFKRVFISSFLISVFLKSGLSLALPRVIPSNEILSPCRHLFETVVNASGSVSQRDLSQIDELKIMELNFKSFAMGDAAEDQFQPHWKPEALAQYVLKYDPDFLVGTEIDSGFTAETFASHFLEDRYLVMGHRGNDRASKDLTFFIKRDLPIDLTLESRKNDLIEDPPHLAAMPLFTRDLPALIIRASGSSHSSKPLAVLIATHKRSQRSLDKMDQAEFRAFQMARSYEVANEYQQRFGFDMPVILAGDFNEDLHNGPNSQAYRGRMLDAFDVAPVATPLKFRGTQLYFPPQGPLSFPWFDSFKINFSSRPYIRKAEVLPFVGRYGASSRQPESYEDREKNYATDHRGVLLYFDFKSYYSTRK